MKENGATCIASASHIAKTTGAEDTKKINLYFDPVPLKEVENYKSEPYFGKLCIILRKISMAVGIKKKNRKANILLTD